MDIPHDIWSVLKEGWGALSQVPGDVSREHQQARQEFKPFSPTANLRASAHREAPTDLLRGLFDTVASVPKGVFRSLVTNPMTEHLAQDPEAARERFYSQSPSERAMQSARNIIEPPLQGDTSFEEKRKSIENVTDFMLPGFGIVKYSEIGPALKASGAGKMVERILSPATVDSDAEYAEALLRGHGGTAARETAQAKAALDAHRLVINQMPVADRLAFIDHIEAGRPAGNLPGPLRQLANNMRAALDRRFQQLTSMPDYAQLNFIDNYFPHMWKDPGTAQQVANSIARSGVGKQGSGASLNKRTIPTIADGLRAGLEPVTTDPIEIVMRYTASMDRFIAAENVLQEAKTNGTVRFIRPKIVGASGHPSSYQVPAGWVPIEGRGAKQIGAGRYFAPEGFARVYNNFLSRGAHGVGAEFGHAYDVALRTSNAITAMELGLSGFHAFTMANEAAVSRLAKGIHDVVGGALARDAGRMLRGAKSAATFPTAPFTTWRRGRQVERAYLSTTPGAPNMNRIVSLLEHAGGRATGKSHAADYSFTAVGDYWRAWRQGALRAQLQADAADIRAAPMLGSLRVGFRHLGRIMETVAKPVFEHYIPQLKNGAFYETMEAWLHANPGATWPEQVAQARVIWDSVDNRFGELVNDNVFWNGLLKQAAQLAMRSYSWNLGTIRELGGGVKDLTQMGAIGVDKALSRLPGRTPPAGRAADYWTPRAAYVLAMPITLATINATYQYLKTGKPPGSLDDLVAGQTGGTQTMTVPRATGFGRAMQSSAPERVSVPGYQKDVFGWYEDWMSEAAAKASRLFSSASELAHNKDWRGDPIFDPEGSAPQWLKQFMSYVWDSYGPIGVKTAIKGAPAGSNITRPEQLMGLRPAPNAIANPQGYDQLQHALRTQAQRKKAAHQRRDDRRYGGDGDD